MSEKLNALPIDSLVNVSAHVVTHLTEQGYGTDPENVALVKAYMDDHLESSKDVFNAAIDIIMNDGKMPTELDQLNEASSEVYHEMLDVIKAALNDDDDEDDDDDLEDDEAGEAEATSGSFKPLCMEINEGLKPALDSLVSSATNNLFSSFDDVITKINETGAKVNDTEVKLRDAESRAAKVALTGGGGAPSVVGGGAVPQVVNVVEKGLDKIFGAKAKALGAMTLPYLEMDGGKDHPYVPEKNTYYNFGKPEDVTVIAHALKNNKTVWLHGLPGTGKTSLPHEVCARLNWPLIQFQMDSGVERDTFIGGMELVEENGATVSKWRDGVLVQAMQMGAVLVLDEMDYARDDVLYVLQGVLEKGKLILAEDGGRIVEPHPIGS